MNLLAPASLKRLFSALMLTALVAVMTGAPGGFGVPADTGIHGSFLERVSYFGLFRTQRWSIFLTLGILAWLVVSFYQPRALGIRRKLEPIVAVPSKVMEKRRNRFILIGVVLILTLLVPHFEHQQFWMYLIVEQIGVWILLAQGLNVVVGFAGLLDLGFAAFYAIGAYTTAWLTGVLPTPALFHHPIPTLWCIPIGVGLAMVFGILLGAPTLRLRGDYLAIVTLGFALIIDDFVGLQSGLTGGGEGSLTVPKFDLNLGFWHYHWGISPVPYFYLCMLFVVIFITVFTSLEYSRIGRSWVAIREDEVAAESVGINPLKYKVMAFAVGAASGGFGGVLTAGLIGNINPTLFQYQVSVNVLILVIFGGMGSIWGVAIGAIIVQTATSYLDNYQPWGYQLQDLYMYIGALLIIMMIFRPAGILPSRRRYREIRAYETEGEGHLDEVLSGDQP
ncbi:MAG: branched-chain amino acid ABC transporter permease [Acidimicrobiales bacterium]